jgi:replicative DNA helicase
MITKSSSYVAAALAASEHCRDTFAGDKGSADWFVDSHERAVAWSSMRLHAEGIPVDVVEIGKLIRSQPKVWRAIGEQIGTAIELINSHITDAYFRWHMGELRDEWRSRATKKLLNDSAEGENLDPGAIAKKLEDLADDSEANTMRDARAMAMELAERLETDYNLATSGAILQTGFKVLDAYTGGLKPEYWIIGARPSVGKTALALSLINNLCRIKEVPTLFASIEMPAPAVCQRLVSMLTGIPYNEIPAKAMSMPVKTSLMQIAKMPLIIEDGNLSIEQLSAKVRTAKRRWGIKLVFVDYVQFLRCDEIRKNRGDRRMEVGEISRQLKNLSRSLEIPIITLAQLNRDQDKRGSAPRLSDLKETGDLEQDADLVGLLYQSTDDKDDDDGSIKRLTLDIAKQRNGRTGQISLSFDGARMQFSETYQ